MVSSDVQNPGRNKWKILERSVEPVPACPSKTFIGEDPEWKSFWLGAYLYTQHEKSMPITQLFSRFWTVWPDHSRP